MLKLKYFSWSKHSLLHDQHNLSNRHESNKEYTEGLKYDYTSFGWGKRWTKKQQKSDSQGKEQINYNKTKNRGKFKETNHIRCTTDENMTLTYEWQKEKLFKTKNKKKKQFKNKTNDKEFKYQK